MDPDWWELTGYMYPTLYPTFLDVPHVPQVGYKWGTKGSPPQCIIIFFALFLRWQKKKGRKSKVLLIFF